MIAEPRFAFAQEVPFAACLNRYEGGACHVVGRGPTEFDYKRLADLREPIFFINDAVCLERYAKSESFFFAHDPHLLIWLDGRIKSTAVLPIDGKLFRDNPGITLNHRGKVVFYHWRDTDRQALLYLTREQIAELKQLYTHTGTIHSLLHFVWFCGFKKVSFVGCDCITDNRTLHPKFQTGDGYDARLLNLSGSSSGTTYAEIGRAQGLLSMLFGFETVYLGTPKANG